MSLAPKSFEFALDAGVGIVTLSRPDRLNALTFEVYRELTEFFEDLGGHEEVRAAVLRGRGKAFCSGGDVDEIIRPLLGYDMKQLLDFTRQTGALIRAIRRCPVPVIAAIQGVAVGAGAVIALACDMRVCGPKARFGFIFPQVGLSGADMGAAYLLPRVVGLGHASELLFTGEIIDVDRALEMGLVTRKVAAGEEETEAIALARRLAAGPAFAHRMTKRMIENEASMSLEEAIEAEAQAQALCMQHPDFRIAHEAFKTKASPKFTGAPE
ncbi:MAG: enoyl-CoA hydratase family protein [Deltaproteobacteria bacterium]|nr:MAG: enoyl-CoA hydratase family protein [Deltaproteobacteria bacterium]